MRTLVDTDIWSEIFKGKNATVFEVVQRLQRVQREDRIEAFREMLKDMEVLELDQNAADLAGVIHGELQRNGNGIDMGDAQNAAIALRHRVAIATGNVRHYSRIEVLGYPLIVQNWREPAG